MSISTEFTRTRDVVTYTGGYYYLISTEWTNLQIARSQTIEALKTAQSKVIYSDTNANRCCNVWAPEIHYFDGTRYLYYTAGNANDLNTQYSHVPRGNGATRWHNWSYAGQLTNDWGNYFVYSCITGVPNQSTCLRKLGDNKVSLTGSLSIISQPDQPWERSGVPVQEGPAALYFGGKTYIAYSANYCWTPDYCVTRLEWDGRTDQARPQAWKKSNGFFMSTDGHETWVAFHATSNANSACDDSRYEMVQPLRANADGSPNFSTVQGSSYQWGEPSS
ncbi:glycosyl hydrolase [Ilyonectria destructans]|nr:glycosyl hydrolase [Ilyonectria destructans]